jgi:hypothetical protein
MQIITDYLQTGMTVLLQEFEIDKPSIAMHTLM